MKIESLLYEAHNEESSDLDYYDFVIVCVEASKQMVNKLQSKNIDYILENGFDEEFVNFYIDRYIANNSLFEKYNITLSVVEDYLDNDKKRKKKKNYAIIRTEVTFPVELLFDKQTSLKRAKK